MVEQLATPLSGGFHEVTEPVLPAEYAEQYAQACLVRKRVDHLVVDDLRVDGANCQVFSSVDLWGLVEEFELAQELLPELEVKFHVLFKE